ncbi:predicted glutamine amidotransferase [Mycoplasma sp. CAG:611]|nr:predicted glutamine amidotransferase [Mycoplasma sp. CAG:611]
MEITIGHLYYDLMNLYGEIGNIKVLTYHLKNQGIKVNIKNLSIDDDINFDELDLIYIGSGTNNNQLLVLNDILKYKEDIHKYYNDNKFFLITGNAIELFGEQIIDIDNNVHDGLKLFDYYTKENKKRIVNEVYIPSLFTKENILGFNNHFGSIYKDNIKLDNKFIFNNNFYGTYTLGLLPRNPSFTKYFIKQLIINKNKKFKIKDFNFKLDKKAYTDFITFKSNIK